MKIFIVEDEKQIRDELTKLLERYGYTSASSDDFRNITSHITDAQPDLILLDINLPYRDGYEVCREIRKKSDVPVIVLTSRNTDFDELFSLSVGADDYISKPYNTQVLLARIQKVLKRAYEMTENCYLNHKGLLINMLKATMSYNGEETELTKNELGILRLLILNKGKVIPRDAIVDELWQEDEFIDENTLNVNILRLRKKLAEIGCTDFLETKRGMGYRV